MTDLLILILAGGQSKRMGKPKAWLTYHNQPQVLWLVDLLKPYGQAVWISINETDKRLEQLETLSDDLTYANHGPISGVLSAYKKAQKALLVVGCDYPNIDRTTLENLIHNRDKTCLATCFVCENHVEPLCAIYEKDGLKTLLQQFHEGNDSLSYFLNHNQVKKIVLDDTDKLQSIDHPTAHANWINTHKTNKP